MNRTARVAIVFGLVGVAVAVALMISSADISMSLLLTLWPTSIFGFGFNGPTFSPLGLLIGTIELGGNFFLYALVGFLLASAWKFVWRRS
jgi:hypothetical protein